jgi:hypothetical protein
MDDSTSPRRPSREPVDEAIRVLIMADAFCPMKVLAAASEPDPFYLIRHSFKSPVPPLYRSGHRAGIRGYLSQGSTTGRLAVTVPNA